MTTAEWDDPPTLDELEFWHGTAEIIRFYEWISSNTEPIEAGEEW